MASERECNECGAVYDVRRKGVGGGYAREGDAERFPFDEVSVTGVRREPGYAHWMSGAHCSEECYAAAYYEPTEAW